MHTRLLIIDEESMVGRMRLGQIILRLQAIFGNTLPFGGVDVVLVGDTGQLPPVFDTPKFDESYKKKGPIPPTVVEGLKVYKMFSTVVQLKRSFRQDSSDVFYSTLQRMRQGSRRSTLPRLLDGRSHARTGQLECARVLWAVEVAVSRLHGVKAGPRVDNP